MAPGTFHVTSWNGATPMKLSDFRRWHTRRAFLGRTANGLGIAALASLLAEDADATDPRAGTLSALHHAPRAKRGIWLSELLPHTGTIADDICVIKSLHTEAINHDPAITFIQTGSQQPGRPSMGSWLSYGIGSENHDLPAYIVLISLASNGANDQPLFGRLWGSGFLPSVHQRVKLRSSGDPVLYLNNPPGIDRA